MKSDIILAGVGGQGILTIATILGAAALRDNLYLKQAEVHGMSQRGGDVQSNLRISSNPIHSDLIPTGGADLIVSLEPMEALRYKSQLNPEGWLITNTNPFVNIDNYPDMDKVVEELGNMNNVIAFDMDEIAKEIHSPRSSNMILLGAASAFIDIKAEEIEKGIAEFFGKKGESVVNTNIEAFRVGREKAENLR
ncbi:MAG: indolepyruvate oxidoreductase subunit beta [Muribaculaceae bacterium]|nr:indolepyruvate oxidoreductase subunit beta [Muribaculaceae bacterium]